MAGFCLDESSFRHVADLPLVIRRLNDQLSTIHNQHRQQVFKSSELDYVEVVEGVKFCDLLYDAKLGLIDHDERVLLLQTINRCVIWDAEDFEIPDGDICFNGVVTDSASIMFVAANALKNVAVGIIASFPLEGLGRSTVTVAASSSDVFHVGLHVQLEPYYRFAMCFEEVARDRFRNWVHLSFPRLRFPLEIDKQIRRLRQEYDEIRETIVVHLAAINDDFFSQLVEGRQMTDICNYVRAKCRVDISPESPNTHGNAKAMREREVVFDGKTIVCEFHSKLTPTHDRIHFSSSLFSDKNDNVFLIVGPFADHLTT